MQQPGSRFTPRVGQAQSACARAALEPVARAAAVWIERLESRRLLTGTISGTAFVDNNSNSAIDAGEATILNAVNSKPTSVTVFLDLNHTNAFDAGDQSINVDVNGNYSFNGLADGNYSIGEVTPTGYIRTGTAFLSATITGGNTVTGKNLGNFPVVFDAGTAGNGSDQYTVRVNSGDTTRLEVVQQILGQSAVTFSIPKASLSSTTININAGGGDDMFSVDFTNGSPIPTTGVFIDGGTQSSSNGDRMTVTGSTGPDSILINNALIAPGAGIPITGVEKVTVNGGNGNDTLTMGATQAEVVFDGGANTDTLNYSASDSPDIITLNANGFSTASFGATTYTNTEGLIVNGMGQNDFITLNGSAAGVPVTVNGGDGNDTLVFSLTPLSPFLFHGGLNVSDHDKLQVNAGTYTLDADASAGSSNLAVSVASSATAVFNSTQHLESLTIDNGGLANMNPNGNRVLVTRGLTIASTGKLDLADNDMIVDYSAVSPVGTWNGSVYTGVTGLVQTAFNKGPWDGPGGIRTSSANNTTRLGVTEAAQTLKISGTQTAMFDGQTVDSSAVLVKFTYAGDANLDGKLDVDDYGRIDFNIGIGSHGWFNGDFNYDGEVNVDDYGILDFTAGIQGPPL